MAMLDTTRLPHRVGDRLLRVGCVQLASGNDVEANLAAAEMGVRQAADRGARLVVLPEKWNLIGDAEVLRAGAETVDGPSITAVRRWARELDVHIVAGSVALREHGADRLRNASFLVTADGSIAARYDKLHMFDVDIAGVSYRESDAESPGDDIVVVEVDGIALGMTVCYDLRFPELYRILALRGARVLVVPAAFTERTGRDHWEVLLRARAIENACFVVACGIIGDHGDGKVSYGRSMVVDPWGVVLAQAPDVEGMIVVDLDLAAVDRVRAAIPSLASRRPEAYRWPQPVDSVPG